MRKMDSMMVRTDRTDKILGTVKTTWFFTDDDKYTQKVRFMARYGDKKTFTTRDKDGTCYADVTCTRCGYVCKDGKGGGGYFVADFTMTMYSDHSFKGVVQAMTDEMVERGGQWM